MRILKRHIGRPVDFLGSDGATYNGRIEKVSNGIATIRYWVHGPFEAPDGYTAYIPVRDKRILEVW